MAKQKLDNTEPKREVFYLNDKGYYLDSVTEDGNNTLNAITVIDTKITDSQEEIGEIEQEIEIFWFAKDSLITKLENLTKDFESAPGRINPAKSTEPTEPTESTA